MLEKSGEWTSLSSSDLRGNVLVFITENGFVIYGLHYVDIVSLYAHFAGEFYHKWTLNFVKNIFMHFFEMII